MAYDIKDKLEWTIIFILEFGTERSIKLLQRI